MNRLDLDLIVRLSCLGLELFDAGHHGNARLVDLASDRIRQLSFDLDRLLLEAAGQGRLFG